MQDVIDAVVPGRKEKKSAERAEELAREQQSQALAEQKRLEEKYGLTPGELAREQRLLGIPQGDEAIKFASSGLEERRQSELERRAGMSGEDILREVGPQTRQLLDTIAARQGKTGEQLFKEEGAIPQALSDQILAEVKDPAKFYQETLQPKLELARQMVNQEANRRGVFGGLPEGGIRFENLGRAGVELAIKSAEAQMAQRQQALANASLLTNQYFNLSSGARSEAGTVSERALTSKERASTELAQFLQDLQQQSAASKGRAASTGIAAANITQPSVARGYENLMGIEGYKESIQGPAEAGLSMLGQIGADYLGEQIKPKDKTSISPEGIDESSLGYLRKSSGEYDPFSELGGISGSEEIALRKRYPGLLG